MAHLLRGIPHKGGVGTLLPRLHEQRDTADLGRGLLVRHQKHRRTKQPQDGRFPHTHHTAGCRRVIEPNPSQGKPRRVIPDSSLSYGKGLRSLHHPRTGEIRATWGIGAAGFDQNSGYPSLGMASASLTEAGEVIGMTGGFSPKD